MSDPRLEENEAFAVIIDNSSSAAQELEVGRRIAQLLHDVIGVIDEDQFKLFMIGNATPVSLTALRQTGPPTVGRKSQPCSLIAPIMQKLVQDGRKRSVIIIGNGEIFDLDDWTDDPIVDGWLLVQTGKESLQRPDGQISEITLEQIGGDVDTLLSYLTRFSPKETEEPALSPDENTFDWRVDEAGYPLLFVEQLQLYVHLFPISKPQFEKFISSGAKREYGDDWYEEINKLSPRASYRSEDIPTIEQLLMTGLKPVEALAFGRWMGRNYALLSAQQWGHCYNSFGEQTAPALPTELRGNLSRDALGIWEMIEAHWHELSPQPNLRELSLMTQGILEWVEEQPERYCGLGDPASSKYQRRPEDPVRPIDHGRLRNMGFRLCTR
jgi:hypothetical protein